MSPLWKHHDPDERPSPSDIAGAILIAICVVLGVLVAAAINGVKL